jgi:radical SAM protein with 4Fe4S-binding SPASM domain
MALIDKFFSKLSSPLDSKGQSSGIQSGIYHYSINTSDAANRIHLRIEPDGLGILILNANQILHLNQTAAYMAFFYLEQISMKEIQSRITRDFRISSDQVEKDFIEFKEQFSALINPFSDACPICDLGIEATMPFSHIPSAPYRMDLAITYRCNNDCSHCYNARSRNHPDLETKDWKGILNKLWSLGIPHIVFTGGEPTLRPDLAELIQYAEGIGQITGLNTNGRRLCKKEFTTRLVNAGLDHIQITLESQIMGVHDQMVGSKGAWTETVAGLRNAVKEHLYVMTNTTLLRNNYHSLAGLLDFLADEGVKTVGLNALIYSGQGITVGTGLEAEELPALLEIAREKTSHNNQKLIWYTPTQYCHFDPVQMELGVKGCTAALFNMCVEPDGSVIPCQSYYSSLGKIQSDPWQDIWGHPLAKSLRERKSISAKCLNCSFIAECGGGCPLAMNITEPNPDAISNSEFA